MRKIFMNVQKLSFLLVSVFFLACENPSEIGYDFFDQGNSKSFFTDTLSLSTSTVLSDSNVNGRQFYVMTGFTEDPIFGKISAPEAYLQPTLFINTQTGNTVPYASISGKKYIGDSVSLRLTNTGLLFGDTLQINKFTIHRLKQSMSYTKSYNGNEALDYDQTPIGSLSINPAKSRTIKADSINQYFLNLPKSIAEELLKLSSISSNSNAGFTEAFKGFAIVADKGNKSVFTFNTGVLNALTSTLVLYYHEEGATNALFYQFDFNGPRHSKIDFDRNGTALSNLSKASNELSSKVTNNQTFIQAGSGLSTKINLDAITKLGGNLKISKATLEFTVDVSKRSKQFVQIGNYVLAEAALNNQQARNSSKRLNYIYPLGTDVSGTTGILDSTASRLSFDITYQLQKLSNKSNSATNILLLPGAASGENTSILANDNLYRAVINKPKLLLYYSK